MSFGEPPLKKRKSRFGAKVSSDERARGQETFNYRMEEERKRKAALDVAAKLGSLIGNSSGRAPHGGGPPHAYPGPRPGGGFGMRGNMMMGPGQSETLHVPSEKVGVIIGKGGSKIRELQELTSTQIEVARESDPATPHLRDVIIRGEKHNVERAKKMVFDTINQIPGFGGFNINGPQSDDFMKDVKTIQVPVGSVGMLIGKGGETIRRIKAETQCNIHVEREQNAQHPGVPKVPYKVAPKPGHQNVYLKGSDEAVKAAESAIWELLGRDRQRHGYGGGQQQHFRPPPAAYGGGYQQPAWGYPQYPGYPPQYGGYPYAAQPQAAAYGQYPPQPLTQWPPAQAGATGAYDPYAAGQAAAAPPQPGAEQQGMPGQAPPVQPAQPQPGNPPQAHAPVQQPPPNAQPSYPPPVYQGR